MSTKKEAAAPPEESEFITLIVDKIDEIDKLILNYQTSLTQKGINGERTATAELIARCGNTIQELRLRPTLCAGRIDPDDIEMNLTHFDKMPSIIERLVNTQSNISLLRQTLSKRLSAQLRKVYGLTKIDAVDNPELIPFRDRLAEIFAKSGETRKMNEKEKKAAKAAEEKATLEKAMAALAAAEAEAKEKEKNKGDA